MAINSSAETTSPNLSRKLKDFISNCLPANEDEPHKASSLAIITMIILAISTGVGFGKLADKAGDALPPLNSGAVPADVNEIGLREIR